MKIMVVFSATGSTWVTVYEAGTLDVDRFILQYEGAEEGKF